VIAEAAAVVVRDASRRLAAAGCESPRLDAELLLAHLLGIDRTTVLTRGEQPLDDGERSAFEDLLKRRERREPVAYLTGIKGFRHLDLEVDRRVLIPRPDTEALVEVGVDVAPDGARVHDVGTGSGAVALALAQERPDLTVTASDSSPGAVEVARANAARLGLHVPVEVANGLPAGAYDLVVANLPYVRADEWDDLAPEIREYEPREALVSGEDGLDAIRSLVLQAEPGTLLALEHAPSQAQAVRSLLRDGARTVPDLGGRDRVTVGSAP
jgi:release factor glutamine methyltransferase